MKKKFELILTDEPFDPDIHNIFYYDDVVFINEKLDVDSSLCLFSKRVEMEPILSKTNGGTLKLIKGAETKEENEANWHTRKEKDETIWSTIEEKEKNNEIEKKIILEAAELPTNVMQKCMYSEDNQIIISREHIFNEDDKCICCGMTKGELLK